MTDPARSPRACVGRRLLLRKHLRRSPPLSRNGQSATHAVGSFLLQNLTGRGPWALLWPDANHEQRAVVGVSGFFRVKLNARRDRLQYFLGQRAGRCTNRSDDALGAE